MKGIVKLDSDQFVPGHGDVQTRANAELKLSQVEAERAKIVELVKQGQTLQQIETAVGDPPPAPAGARAPMFAPYPEVVHKELTQPAK